MGSFKAGHWLIGISIYFFLFFFIVYSGIQGGNDYEIDTSSLSANDVGFQTQSNPFDSSGQCTGGTSSAFSDCELTDATTNKTCQHILGCTWTGTICSGTPAYSPQECSDSFNETLCLLMKCSWVSYTSQVPETIDQDDSADLSSIKETFGIMTGFNASIGLPSTFAWVFSFFFFWIPFVMFLWALYMALPFFH